MIAYGVQTPQITRRAFGPAGGPEENCDSARLILILPTICYSRFSIA
jgi:hypothetical protein